MTTTQNIVESESIIQEYGRKVTKLWTEVMEAEGIPHIFIKQILINLMIYQYLTCRKA